MSRFPGKVNLVNLIKKKNRNLLVFKRVQVTSTNGEDNLTTNTSTSNGGDFSHVKNESDLDFNNSPSPLVPSSRQDASSSLSSSPDNGHEAVSTSDRTSSSIDHQATQSINDVNNINNDSNGAKLSDNNCVNSSSSSDNIKYDSSTRQDIRENILNSKEIKASTGLSFFQSLVNPTSASPDKSLDEDEDNEDEEKFTFEGFSQDEVDENRRRILQEYELLSTDSSSSSDSADSDYVNCKSNIEDSTSDDSDTHQSNEEEQQPPVKISTSKTLHQSTSDSSTTTTATVTASNPPNSHQITTTDLKSKGVGGSQVTLRSTNNASPTVSSSPGVKIAPKNRRSSASSKVNAAKDNNRNELTCKETQQQPKTSRLVKSRPNYESNGVEDEISANGKRKSSITRKKKAHFDSITNSPTNEGDDVLSSIGSKNSAETSKRKKRKISTGKEASGNANLCDESSLIVSSGTTNPTTTSSSLLASPSTASTSACTSASITTLTSTIAPTQAQSSSNSSSTLNKCTSPVPSSSTNNGVKVQRDKTRPLTINTNYETITSSKRRKEEIISRALVALQSQWRERFLQSQQTQPRRTNSNTFKGTNGHNNNNSVKCNEFDFKGDKIAETSTLSINGSLKSSTNNLDSNHITSTSGSFSGSKFNCNLTSNDSPAFSSSSTGPSNSILRQPRLQVNQSTLNYIRNTHRNSLESSSRGSRSSVSSESSLSPSDSDSESSYESSSSEEEQEESISTSDDDDGHVDGEEEEEDEDEEDENDESSSNDESDDSNVSYDSSLARKKQAKSFANSNFTGPPSKVKRKNDSCNKITDKKGSNGTNGSVNRTLSNLKSDNGPSVASSNVKKAKKSPVKVTKKKSENKLTAKSRNENGGCKSKKKNPGTITCAICFTVKYYSHKQRRFGQFSCEPCSKFFASFLRSPRAYFCEHTGDCAIDTTSGNGRCRACWLKLCLQKFNFPDKVRGELTENNFLPKLKSEPHVSLIAVDTGSNKELSVVTTSNSIGRNVLDIPYQCSNTSQSKGKSNGINGHPKSKKNSSSNGTANNHLNPSKSKSQSKIKSQNVKSNTGLLMVAPQQSSNINSSLSGQNDQNSSSTGGRGPRVKRVCRTIATGLPRATFSSRETDEYLDEDMQGDEDDLEQSSDQSSDEEMSTSSDESSSSEEDGDEDDDDDNSNDDDDDDNDSASVDSDSLPVTEYIIRAFERETQTTGQRNAGCESKKKEKQIKKTKKVLKDKIKNGKKSSASKSSSVDRSNAGKKVTVKSKKQGQQQSKVKSNSCQQSKRSKTSNKLKPETAKKKKSSVNSSSDSSSSLKFITSNINTPTTSSSSPVKKIIKKRCGTCSGCTALDCGECTFCKDKKKFGGPNIIKQACKLRKCIQMTSPQQ